ncbi:hypothetical protein EDB87DRAFT_1637418 [Lactarius vividus]|nr:hypothetical protein EDB87DRAFT_1637418 [Lactarius vividus]
MTEKPSTDAILGSRLYDLLKTCMPGTSPLDDEERKSRLRVCLKCLWYFGRAYNRPGASEPLPPYFPRTLASPESIRRIQTERDPISRVMGLCFSALVVTKLAADVRSRTDTRLQREISDDQLACLSAIIGTKSHDVKFCLKLSGAVELANMISLAWVNVGPLAVDGLPSDVLDVAQQTLAILSQALPGEETTELQLDQSIAQPNILDGKFDRIIVSRLHGLLQKCISSTSPLQPGVRRSCLRMCLKSLWYCAKAYLQLGASRPLPSYFPRVLATPEISRHIQQEMDHTSRVIGRCFMSLVVTKLAADLNSGISRVGNQELVEFLSAILGTERRIVELWLHQPGTIEHMGLFLLALGEYDSVVPSLVINTEQSDVLDVVKQTLNALFHILPAGLNADMWPPVSNFDGKFTPILRHWLTDLLGMRAMRTPPLANDARIMYLKSLWFYETACHHLRAPRLVSAPPAFSALDFPPIHFITPEFVRRIHTEEDLVARVLRRCFVSLVVNRLVGKYNPFRDRELVCISAILGIERLKVAQWLFLPGAIQLVNMVSFAFAEVSSFVNKTVPSEVLRIVGQTIGTLARALPADLKVELQLDQADSLMKVPDNSMIPIITTLLRDLLKTCTLRTLPLPEEVRAHCLQMCLNGLWCWGQMLDRLGASEPLPAEFLDLAGLEVTRHIRTEKDQASRVMGRCVEALVVNNLVAHTNSRTNSTVQISDKTLGCFSAILGTESRDVMLWLNQLGAIEFVNIVFLAFGDIGALAADTLPSYVLNVVPQTFSILYQALPSKISTEFQPDQIDAPVGIHDGTAPLMGEIYQDCSIGYLKDLWRCVRAYNQPGNSVPLPPHVLIAFASPTMTHRIRTERDVVARVIGRCVEALVVQKLVAGVGSNTRSNVQIGDEQLACLSAIFGTKGHDVKLWLHLSGIVELANMVSLQVALGDVSSLDVNALSSDVLDVVQQTLSNLSQALLVEETVELQPDQPIAQLITSDGKFDRIIISRIRDLLRMCISAPSPLRDEARKSCLRVCLKSLWYYARAYHRLGASKPLPPYFSDVIAAPEITRHIQQEEDLTCRVIGHCYEALVVTKLAADFNSGTVRIGDRELECLSAILVTESHDVAIWLRLPGTVALANMASLTFNNIVSLTSDSISSDMRDMIHQTLGILSWSLPDQLDAGPELDGTNAPLIALPRGQFEPIVISHLYNLFETCTRRIPRLAEEVRTSCLRMCLKSLWNYGKAYHQLGTSELLPSHVPLTLGGPQMIRRIKSERDHPVCVMGQCFEALLVNGLAARVKSRTDSTVLISDKALECLLTILGTECDDIIHWLSRPGAVELANVVSLIFSEIHSPLSDTAPSSVLDMVQQTFSILIRTLPVELNAELWPDEVDTSTNFTDGTSPLTAPINESRLRICLKNLWHCARAYNQLGISVPLPFFVRTTVASSEITRRIHTESDLTARVTGRCACALIVNKLVDDFQSRMSFGNGAYDSGLACISSILGTDPVQFLRWPRPSVVIKIHNVVSLMSGEIEALFTSGATPADVLDIVQQTLDFICSELVLAGVFAGGDLPMDQVLSLREICFKIANAKPTDLFRNQTMGILDQLQKISKQIPAVEYRMRRCTSSVFDPKSIRGRSKQTSRSKCEVRGRRSRSM